MIVSERGGARASRPARRVLYLGAIKLAAAVVLVWLALRKVDFARAFALIAAQSFSLSALALVFLFLQAVLSSWRWMKISRYADAALSFPQALKFTMLSLFYNQALPSFLPGDACRVWGAARGCPVRHAATGVILDRVVTLAALLSLAIISLGLFVFHGRPWLGIMVGLAAIACCASLGMMAIGLSRSRFLSSLLPEPVARLAVTAVRKLFFSFEFALLFPFAFAIHGLSIATFYVLAEAMHLPLTPMAAFIAVPMVMVMALLPISINGWGIREGAAVALLAGFGIGRTEAATLSVIFGLFQLALGMAGGLFVLFPEGGAGAKASPHG